MYAPFCPNCVDIVHYLRRHPLAAVAVTAFLIVGSAGFGLTAFAYNDVDFGTDETAEEYYVAILQVHDEIGFSRSEYPPCGLTVAEVKEIVCIDTDEEAMFWLAEERNNLTGRLYYYVLLGRYQSMLSHEDSICGSSCTPDNRYYVMELIKDPSIVKLDGRIYGLSVYDLATVAYFNGVEGVDEYLRDQLNYPLVTRDELNRVKEVLEERAAAVAAAEAGAAA